MEIEIEVWWRCGSNEDMTLCIPANKGWQLQRYGYRRTWPWRRRGWWWRWWMIDDGWWWMMNDDGWRMMSIIWFPRSFGAIYIPNNKTQLVHMSFVYQSDTLHVHCNDQDTFRDDLEWKTLDPIPFLLRVYFWWLMVDGWWLIQMSSVT